MCSRATYCCMMYSIHRTPTQFDLRVYGYLCQAHVTSKLLATYV